MNRLVSQKFKVYAFLCIVLLLFVHGYNLKEGYLLPYSSVDEPLTFTTFIEYFLANGALRFRIPMLFMISGYIFALQDQRPYGERMKKRFKTLIIPFLIWSAVGLGITYLWQQFPVTAQAVRDSQLDQLGDNRPYEEIGWSGVLWRWLVQPISFQLWFIRSLFFYNALYPLFKWCITRYPKVYFTIMFLLWATMFNFLFLEGQGLFFFSVGIWICKSNYRIDKKPEWFSNFLTWLFFIGISVIRTFMAFELEPYATSTIITLMVLHIISVSSGVLAIWYGADDLVKWLIRRKWFVWSMSFAFIIYALHVPLLQYLTRLSFIYLNDFRYYRLLMYFTLPVIVVLFCIGVGALLRAVAPKAYRVATGGRGF